MPMVSSVTDSNITLENLNIDLSGMSVEAGSDAVPLLIETRCKVTVTLKGENSLTGGPGKAALQLNGGGSLLITGDGSLTATGGGNGDRGAAGAGITCKHITIAGGTIRAVGATTEDGEDTQGGAGIGADAGSSGGTDITITGGNITAIGGAGGSGGTLTVGPEETGKAALVPYIMASSISHSDSDDTDYTDSWYGVVFQGEAGQVYGRCLLGTDATIPEGYTLTIPKESGLQALEGTTLTNNGTLLVAGGLYADGAFVNNGMLRIEEGGDMEIFKTGHIS